MSVGGRGLTFGQAIFVRLWLGLTWMTMGEADLLTEEYVRTHGVRRFLGWVRAIARTLESLEQRYGDAEAQMIAGFAALWTGCRWCGVGYMYSANLMIFKGDGSLGPVDERLVVKLQTLRDEEVIVELERRLQGPRWQPVRAAMQRQYELHAGITEALDDDDALLRHTNRMWEWVTECSIIAMDRELESITPRSGIGRDRALIARYRDARRRALST